MRRTNRPADIWPDPDPRFIRVRPQRKQPQDREWLPWLLGAVAVAIIIAAGMAVAHALEASDYSPGCSGYYKGNHWVPVHNCHRRDRTKTDGGNPVNEPKTIVIILKP
jgi:hypothetical protein